MSIFDKAFDRATGYNSSSGLFSREEEEEDNMFANTFDSIFDESTIVPNDDLIGSVMRQRTQQPLAEPEMGLGQAEPRIPSRAMPGSDFMVGAREPRQDSAEMGAMTELSRNIKLFKELGLEEEYEAEVEATTDSFGFDSIIEPAFDFLSIANYSIAGGLEEYLLTNSPIAGLQQAGEEFLNALPGVEMEGARRTTFSDILSGKRGRTDLTMSEDSPYATAAAGFVLDVILDPTTWFGFGLAKVAVGIGRADKAAGAALNMRRVSDVVSNSEAGKTFRRMFVPNSLVKGLKDGYQAEEIANTINRIKKEQGSAEVITKEDVMEGGVDFLAKQIRRDATIGMQTNALREKILSTASEMNEGELRLVGAYLDQPDVVEGLIGKLKVDDETKVVIKKGVEGWQEVMQKFFDEEEAVGLLDRAQFRVNYSAGMEPVTELSRSIVETMFKVRFGEDAGSAMYKKASADGIATVTENGIMKASYAKKYPTLESRLHALVPTETNVALMATRRGVESIKKVNTQKFYDTIISDTRIAVPIDQVVAENARSPLHEMLKDNGMDIWKAPALSIRKGAKQASGEEGVYYAIPSAMKEQLDDMTKMIQGSDETSGLLSTFRQVQGLWKSYALLSPGYHMRNLYSNLFNNYLAGVTNPVRYAEAMLLQVDDTANIGSRAVRSKIERILGGRKTSADYIFTRPDGTKLTGKEVMELANERKVAEAGLIYNESDLGIGADLMTRMQLRKGKPTTSEIDTDMADWGDRAERISNVGASMLAASKNAGGRLTQEEADKTAEIYDVIARSWAWKNWKTPEEWYENRIREIRAYTLPVPGQPDSGLSELFQTAVPNKIDISNPSYQKAVKTAYYREVDPSNNLLIMPTYFHGTEVGADVRGAGEISMEVGNVQGLRGPGLYMTQDLVPFAPERGPQITTGYMGGKLFGKDERAAFLGQREYISEGERSRYIVDSLPELREELERFGHEKLLVEGNISGTPWKPIGPSSDQLDLVKARAVEILESADDDTKFFYENYLAQRKAASNESVRLKDPEGNVVSTTIPRTFNVSDVESILPDRMPWTDIDDWTTINLIDFDVVTKTTEGVAEEGRSAAFKKIKPPDDETLRELVALERYYDRWTVDIPSWEKTLPDKEVFAFNWFTENPYTYSQVLDKLRIGGHKEYAQSGAAYKTLAVGETLVPNRNKPSSSWTSTNSKKAAKKEIEETISSSASVTSAIVARAVKIHFADAAEAKAAGLSNTYYGNGFFRMMADKNPYQSVDKMRKMNDEELYNHFYGDATEGIHARLEDNVNIWEEAHKQGSYQKVADDLYKEYPDKSATELEDEIENMVDNLLGSVARNTPVARKLASLDWDPMAYTPYTRESFAGFSTRPKYKITKEGDTIEDAAKEDGVLQWIDQEIANFSGFFQNAEIETAMKELGYGRFIDPQKIQRVSPADFKAMQNQPAYNSTQLAQMIFPEALSKLGYDGVSHAGGTNYGDGLFHQVGIAWNPEQVKSVDNVGTWNLSNTKFMEQHGSEGMQGAIKFLDDGRADIMATADADPSTFIHELGHLIRRTMLDDGDQDIIHRWILRPENSKSDAQYVRVRAEMVEEAERAAAAAPNAGIDVEDMATQLMERFIWTREGEERFAKGFEQFLLEGITDKNAGKPMQGTFDYMKEMLDTVYDYSGGFVSSEGTPGVGLVANDETRHVLQNILGRGVETEPEGVAMAEAILGTATTADESLFSRAYGLLGDNFLTRANRNFGQQMENNSRIAHFITMMMTDTGKIKGNGILNKKATGVGMNADEAAESVRRYLFDYGELTPFERDYMKTVIPFYTWMRKNIPLQFQQMFENPERYSKVPKLQHAIESVSGDWENTPTPDYFDDINAMRMPFTSDEIPLEDDGMPMYFAPDLPYGDLNRLNMKDMVSSMTPFLKTWAEIYPKQGYSFFLDSEIQDYEDQPAVFDFFGSETELPFDEKTYHAIKTLLPPVGKLTRLGERASEGKFTEQMLREAAGLNFRSVDVDAVVRAKRFKRREVSRAVKKRLIDKARLMGFEDALEDMQDD